MKFNSNPWWGSVILARIVAGMATSGWVKGICLCGLLGIGMKAEAANDASATALQLPGVQADQTVNPPNPKSVFTFDARSLRRFDASQPAETTKIWDRWHVLTALQGLANRGRPQLYVFYCQDFGVDTDQFWFDWFRDEDGWLKDAQIKPLTNLTEVVRAFRNSVNGLVVYDPAVPATANVASTAAGCEGLLPVRFDPSPGSVYTLLREELKVPVKLWLVNPDGTPKFTGKGTLPDFDLPSSGSAKADAYRWAIRRFLQTGQCDARYAAYYIDAFWLKNARNGGPDLHTLSNHDYFISRRAFFFDLSPWGDECPNDDPNQALGLDRQVFLEVLQALYKAANGEIIKVGGFPPWPYKYTNHGNVGGKHEGVPTEWEFGRLISQFNGYMEADAAGLSAIANASYVQHYPLAARYAQPNARPPFETWRKRGFLTESGKVAPKLYVGYYVGDYDAPSWLYKAVPAFFKDPARGTVPLGWAFDPNLSDRAPQALVYAYRHASTNDYFIAGDSGAGYLNVRGLTERPDSGLPGGLQAWVNHCKKYYEKWDMSITGFVLDGSAGAATAGDFAAYQSFSPNGVGTHFEPGPRLKAGLPTCPETDLPDSPEAAVEAIRSRAANLNGNPGFLWARTILRSPKYYLDVSEILAKKYPDLSVEVVDPYTFFGLIKRDLQQKGR